MFVMSALEMYTQYDDDDMVMMMMMMMMMKSETHVGSGNDCPPGQVPYNVSAV